MIDNLSLHNVTQINKESVFEMANKIKIVLDFISKAKAKYGTFKQYDCFSIFKKQKVVEFDKLYIACLSVGKTIYLEDEYLMHDIFIIDYIINW